MNCNKILVPALFALSASFSLPVTAEDCSELIQKLYNTGTSGYYIEYNLTVNTSDISLVTYSSGFLNPEVFLGEKVLVARERDLLYSNKTYIRKDLCVPGMLCVKQQPFDITKAGNITLALHTKNKKTISLKYNHYNQSVKISSVQCQHQMLSGLMTSANGFQSLLTLSLRKGGMIPIVK